MMKNNPFFKGYYQSEELMKMGFKKVGKNVHISKSCTIIGLENISLGNNIRIDDNAIITCNNGFLKMGNYIHIGGNCYISCNGGVEMRDFSGLSQGVCLYSCSDDYSGKFLTNPTIPKKFLNVNSKSVLIGKHVILGSGCVVLPGVEIGEGTSIGALSLVTKSLKEWSIYFGSPAKFLKSRRKDLLEKEKLLFQEQKYL